MHLQGHMLNFTLAASSKPNLMQNNDEGGFDKKLSLTIFTRMSRNSIYSLSQL